MVESFIKEAALPARILETSKDVPSSAVNIALYASLTDIDDYLASLELSRLKNCYQRLTFFSSSFPESYSFLLIRFIVAANLGTTAANREKILNFIFRHIFARDY